jgi:hypothetical protein
VAAIEPHIVPPRPPPKPEPAPAPESIPAAAARRSRRPRHGRPRSRRRRSSDRLARRLGMEARARFGLHPLRARRPSVDQPWSVWQSRTRSRRRSRWSTCRAVAGSEAAARVLAHCAGPNGASRHA